MRDASEVRNAEYGVRSESVSPTKAWAKYQNYIIEREKVSGRYYTAYNLKKLAYGDNTAVIDEEIAADYIGDMFKNHDIGDVHYLSTFMYHPSNSLGTGQFLFNWCKKVAGQSDMHLQKCLTFGVHIIDLLLFVAQLFKCM